MKNKIKFKHKKLKSYHDINSSLINSKFVPDKIRKNIIGINNMYTYTFDVKNEKNMVNINLNFLLNKKENISKIIII